MLTSENKIIKVKDTSIIGNAIIITCLFPLVFIFASVFFNLSYLLTALIILTVLVIAIIILIRHLKRNENIYELIADNNSISIQNVKTYNWQDVQSIETFSHKPFYRMRKHYLKLILKNGEQLVLDATNYDIWFEDLKKELLSLMTKNNAHNI